MTTLHEQLSLLEAMNAGVEIFLLKSARVGSDILKDSTQSALPEKTQDVMLMKTCGQMQKKGSEYVAKI